MLLVLRAEPGPVLLAVQGDQNAVADATELERDQHGRFRRDAALLEVGAESVVACEPFGAPGAQDPPGKGAVDRDPRPGQVALELARRGRHHQLVAVG